MILMGCVTAYCWRLCLAVWHHVLPTNCKKNAVCLADMRHQLGQKGIEELLKVTLENNASHETSTPCQAFMLDIPPSALCANCRTFFLAQSGQS